MYMPIWVQHFQNSKVEIRISRLRMPRFAKIISNAFFKIGVQFLLEI